MGQSTAKVMVGLLFLYISGSAAAQTGSEPPKASVIKPFEMAITYYKTSNLIFPYPIKSVDRGSASVLVQKAKGTENILQVKAARQGFVQTNLSVVTADGRLYSFIIDYAPEPPALNFSFLSENEISGEVMRKEALMTGAAPDGATLKAMTGYVQQAHSFLNVTTREQKMKLSLKGIYLSGGVMWLKLELLNRSLIDYKPDYIRFFVRDRKRAKRTAVQEREFCPILDSSKETVAGNSTINLLFAFGAFTIPPAQQLVIQVAEQNGGRTLTLPVSNRVILKTRAVNE